MSVKIKNLDRLNKRLEVYAERVEQTVKAHCYREGEGIMAVAKSTFTPVDTGALRATGHVSLPQSDGRSVTVQLGFGGPAAPYAFYVHENLEAHHPIGSAKYLEIPFRQSMQGFSRRLGQAVRKVPKG